ncbi:MAG: hypothetical protein IKX18_02575 [Muribaculaceae bacterium]|nr:hypothetical protein [Muribaculaceae bacterium]
MKRLTLIMAVVALSMCAQAQVQSGVIEIGDFENASDLYNGSYFDMAPTNFYLAHTGVQMLYTPDLLADLNGKQNVKITDMRFKFYSETFEEITRIIKVYLQETDATEFAVNENGVKQFFNFDGLAMEGNYGFNLLNCYGEDVEVYFPLASAFSLTPGKSLLVTIVFDAQDDDNCTSGSDYAPFYTSGIRGKAMTYTDNWYSFLDYAQSSDFPNATATLGCGTNVELPVTRIKYTYTEGGTTHMRGDVNDDSLVDISDATLLINYLLSGDADGINLDNANCDLEGGVDISDATALINYLLNGTW